MDIDFDLLRDDLINYFGTAIYYNPLAQTYLIMVSNCSENKLTEIAINNNFDLSKYERGKEYEKIK